MTEINLKNWETEVRRGVIQILVLSALTEGETHGKNICERVLKMTEKIVYVPLGTVYPLLRRFINDGLIEAFKPTDGDQRKTIYKINSNGREYYQAIQEKWLRYSTAVSNFLNKRE